MSEYKLRKVNYYKMQGFKITLAKHPEDEARLFVVAVRGEQVLRLFAEPVKEALQYIPKQ